ncbi:endonuclease domain-containing protein [Mycobacterium sp. NPDC003323]
MLDHILAANGGVFSSAQLRAAGAVSRGFSRVRHGWYASPSADPQVVRAVAAGGVLACTSVLRRHQVWVLDSALHIRYAERAQRARPGVRSCHPYRFNPPIVGAVDPLDIAIASAANCLDAEGLVIVLDSMLNKRMIEMADARDIVSASRFARLQLAERCDPKSESGTESMIRLRLLARRIHLRTQVDIAGVGRVDFLVGDRLIIEADSREHHLPGYQSDRRRDRVAISLGYLVIRLTYEDVVYRWDMVEADILTVIRRGAHRGSVITSA